MLIEKLSRAVYRVGCSESYVKPYTLFKEAGYCTAVDKARVLKQSNSM